MINADLMPVGMAKVKKMRRWVMRDRRGEV